MHNVQGGTPVQGGTEPTTRRSRLEGIGDFFPQLHKLTALLIEVVASDLLLGRGVNGFGSRSCPRQHPAFSLLRGGAKNARYVVSRLSIHTPGLDLLLQPTLPRVVSSQCARPVASILGKDFWDVLIVSIKLDRPTIGVVFALQSFPGQYGRQRVRLELGNAVGSGRALGLGIETTLLLEHPQCDGRVLVGQPPAACHGGG